ncbi:MAG: hypothetical protein GY724_20315 [Actinomycetia bacterium]|nr:hypothetical protein [Actinomycetes bacterium]
MTLRIRQIAFVATDLEPVVDELCQILGTNVCFRDPGIAEFGLHNALMPIGDTFLEVVSPITENTTAGRYLERRGGDGGYMVLFQVPDQTEARARIAQQGLRVVWQADHGDITGTHIHPADVPGAIVSLDQSIPPESWRWAGSDWSADTSTAADLIAGVLIQSHRPDELAPIWSEMLGLEPSGRRIEVNADQYIEFVDITDGRPEGISTMDVRSSDADRRGTSSVAGGVTIRFV